MSFAENCEIKPALYLFRVMRSWNLTCIIVSCIHLQYEATFAATLCDSVKIMQLALLLHVAKTAHWPPGQRLPVRRPVPQWEDKELTAAACY